jgi:hypothetical protein
VFIQDAHDKYIGYIHNSTSFYQTMSMVRFFNCNNQSPQMNYRSPKYRHNLHIRQMGDNNYVSCKWFVTQHLSPVPHLLVLTSSVIVWTPVESWRWWELHNRSLQIILCRKGSFVIIWLRARPRNMWDWKVWFVPYHWWTPIETSFWRENEVPALSIPRLHLRRLHCVDTDSYLFKKLCSSGGKK